MYVTSKRWTYAAVTVHIKQKYGHEEETRSSGDFVHADRIIAEASDKTFDQRLSSY
jgi:hypothetical protein